ncbi:hypothetical protein [Psychroserpens mesophilus]|uniref:hypothetical protein n=1 Tax=Psychroserpens mesophilus TaxID=325473 RepID=UPI00058F9CDB|nr:hypothetical protein [Psychroserpens mesophilus]
MELKNYLKRKPEFFIVISLSLMLSSCSTSKDFNSNNAPTVAAQKTDYRDYFDEKVKDYETSIHDDNLYFTDLNTYRSNYFTGKSLFGNYQYIGIGNRFNNVTIDNYGINIYSPLSRLSIARSNWAWTSNQLESWGWINKGWNTPWHQNGWRSISNSWNGPIWNYWGWDGEPENSLINGNNSWARGLHFNKTLGKRQSVYNYIAFNNRPSTNNHAKTSVITNNTKINAIRYASLTKRTTSEKPRSRPRTVIKTNTSIRSNSYVSSNNSTTKSDSKNNSRSTIRRPNKNNSNSNSSTVRTTSNGINSISNSNTIGINVKSMRN